MRVGGGGGGRLVGVGQICVDEVELTTAPKSPSKHHPPYSRRTLAQPREKFSYGRSCGGSPTMGETGHTSDATATSSGANAQTAARCAVPAE